MSKKIDSRSLASIILNVIVILYMYSTIARDLPRFPYPGWNGKVVGNVMLSRDVLPTIAEAYDYDIDPGFFENSPQWWPSAFFPSNESARTILQEVVYWETDISEIVVDEPKFIIIDQYSDTGLYEASTIDVEIPISVPNNTTEGTRNFAIYFFNESLSPIIKVEGEINVYASRNSAVLAILGRIIPWILPIFLVIAGIWLVPEKYSDWGVYLFLLGILFAIFFFFRWLINLFR